MWPFPKNTQLDRIEAALAKISKSLEKLIMTIDELKAKVTKLTSVTAGVLTTLADLSQAIRDLKNNPNLPAAIDALADEIDKDAADLAAGIVANTPAAP